MSEQGDGDQKKKDAVSLQEIDGRLKALGHVDRKNAASAPEAQDGPLQPSGIGLAMRISVEMVVTIVIGCVIGWYLDEWAETRPLFLIIFLFVGGAAGVMNTYRIAKGLDDSVGLGNAVDRKRDDSGNT